MADEDQEGRYAIILVAEQKAEVEPWATHKVGLPG